MVGDEFIARVAGLHTADTLAELLEIKRQSAINLLSKLKKEGYVKRMGGGKQIRLYRITVTKQRKRDPGMFDIINRYSPMKLAPWYDHQVHGKYTVEDALVDAVQTKSFRVILASLRLFGHVKDWKRLHNLAKEKDCWQQIGAMHDVARMHFKIAKMPGFAAVPTKTRRFLVNDYDRPDFANISKKWNVGLPFRQADLEKVEA